MDLINAYLSNNTSLKMFLQNGSLIEEYGNEFIVIDPETGICRDINTTTNLCGIADYIWGDIQLERWILQHWGETTTMAVMDLIQFVNTLVTGAEHVNLYKMWMGACVASDIGQVVIDSGAVVTSAQVTVSGICFSESLIGIPIALLGFYGTTVALDATWDKSGEVFKDYNTFNNEPWFT